MNPQSFVTTYKPFALQSQVETGISYLATLAQSAQETGWGQTVVGNMMFGIKATKDTAADKKQLVITTEYSRQANLEFPEVISVTRLASGMYKYKVRDWFRKYDSPADSFIDHGKFFLTNKRYAEALKVRDDPRAFVTAIGASGYATDPSYGPTLVKIIGMIEKWV